MLTLLLPGTKETIMKTGGTGGLHAMVLTHKRNKSSYLSGLLGKFHYGNLCTIL